MKVLLISDDKDFRIQTKRILDAEVQLTICNEDKYSTYLSMGVDIFILDLNEYKIDNKLFLDILKLKCVYNALVLVRAKNADSSDILEILALGALDVIGNPILDSEYQKKMYEFYRWKWYLDWLKKQNFDHNKKALLSDECDMKEHFGLFQSAENVIDNTQNLTKEDQENDKDAEKRKYCDITLYPLRRKIFRENVEILLTKTEFDIVQYLASQYGRAVTYKELYENVWKHEYIFDDQNIMAHIHRIRKKLEPNPQKPIYIQNVYGVGYRFEDETKKEDVIKQTIIC